jgi:hypothetical protein
MTEFASALSTMDFSSFEPKVDAEASDMTPLRQGPVQYKTQSIIGAKEWRIQV